MDNVLTSIDIHLTRGLSGKLTEPKNYRLIFERGIDPDVDDPEQCHSHSKIPDEWPAVAEILDYQDRVRVRIRSILKADGLSQNRLLGEAMWLGFEHEAMHLETFLYMLLQSDKTLPPSGVATPDFHSISSQARKNCKPNDWFKIPEQKVVIGLQDPDPNVVPEAFGWDNEKPQRTVIVPAFEAKARPITNGEFAHYMQENQIENWPASWTQARKESNGSLSSSSDFISKFTVRTIFGPVPLELAADWPVIASYDELEGYAKWKNCRLPTFEEVKSIYKYSARLKGAKVDGVHSVSDVDR